MMGSALHVRDAVPLQLRFELGAASPGGVLPALIGQDLPRRSVVSNPTRESLQHQHASLVMGHRKAHKISRVIIKERRHIDPLMPPQQEREEVRLPQLIWLGTLEVVGLDLPSHPSVSRLRFYAFGFEHSPHRRLGGTDPQEPLHQIADAATSGVRDLAVRREDRLRTLIRRLLQVRVQRGPLELERFLSALPIRLHPHHRRRVGHAQLARHGKGRQPPIRHRTNHRLAHLGRPRPSPVCSLVVLVPRFARLAFCVHLSTPSLLLALQRARQVLTDYAIIKSRNRWFAAQ
jgi:hypothetical protein